MYSMVIVSIAFGTISPRRSNPTNSRMFVRPPSGTVICQLVRPVQLIGNGTPFTSMLDTAIGAKPVRLTVGSALTKSAPPLLVIPRVKASTRDNCKAIVALALFRKDVTLVGAVKISPFLICADLRASSCG